MHRAWQAVQRRATLVAALLAACGAEAALAQVPLVPRALGTGGAYVAAARGKEVLFLNPANLALPNNPGWSFSLGGLIFGGNTLGPSFEDFFALAGQQGGAEEGDSEEVREILSSVPPSGMELDLTARVSAVALQVGPFAIGAAYTGESEQTLSRDVVDLFLNGFEEGRTDYTLGNTRADRATHLDIAAAYARTVGPVSLGVTGHYLVGRTIARSRLSDLVIDPFGQSLELNYAEVLARDGRGWALDLGAAMQPIPNLTVSGAISNLVGSMDWGNEILVRDVTLTEEDFEEFAMTEIADRFGESERPLSTSGPDARYATLAEGLTDDAGLPRTLRLGAAYDFPTRTTLMAGYAANLTNGRLVRGWEQQIGVGVQQRVLFLSARAGYGTNLGGRSMITAGLSLGPLDVNIAKVSGSENEFDRNGWIVSTGL